MCCSSSSASPFKKPINKLHLQRQEWFIYQWPAPSSLWMPKLHSPLQQIRRTCKAARSRGVSAIARGRNKRTNKAAEHLNARWRLIIVLIVSSDPFFFISSRMRWSRSSGSAVYDFILLSVFFFFFCWSGKQKTSSGAAFFRFGRAGKSPLT